MNGFKIIPLALILTLEACSGMAPTYERPSMPVPANWPAVPGYASTSTQSVSDIRWQEFILDDRLQKVIDQALADSRPLRKAISDIAAARALYRVQRAAELPTVNAGISGTRASTGGDVSSTYAATLGLSSYELDLFGRLRSLSDASLQSYLASAETARATRISLIAETAKAWLTLAADRSKLAIARSTTDSAQRSMELTHRRYDAGVASMVDVRSAETIYQQALADSAALVSTIAQDANALQLLVGSPVDASLLPANLDSSAQWLSEVPAGVSSDVLRKRPDVLSAEHTLQAANANIGAARARFFPTLSLTATGGVASTALSTLFSGGTTVWSLAPSLVLPIFDSGANSANEAYTVAQKQGYIAAYELTVQTAFQEVADVLALRGTVHAQLAAQTALVSAATESYRLADARYSHGADTFLVALTAQRTLYNAQSSRVATQLAELQSRVSLYRYLGGGLAGNSETD